MFFCWGLKQQHWTNYFLSLLVYHIFGLGFNSFKDGLHRYTLGLLKCTGPVSFVVTGSITVATEAAAAASSSSGGLLFATRQWRAITGMARWPWRSCTSVGLTGTCQERWLADWLAGSLTVENYLGLRNAMNSDEDIRQHSFKLQWSTRSIHPTIVRQTVFRLLFGMRWTTSSAQQGDIRSLAVEEVKDSRKTKRVQLHLENHKLWIFYLYTSSSSFLSLRLCCCPAIRELATPRQGSVCGGYILIIAIMTVEWEWKVIITVVGAWRNVIRFFLW